MPVRIFVIAVFLVTGWAATNWAYQVARKPSELFFPVSHSLSKAPAETWRQYGSLFRTHSTATMTPELLAAIAQVEGAGNPVARTYWRWRPSWSPFAWYQPASSAVGMYQITDGTFEQAKHFCVHDHVVAEAGAWDDVKGCWFNGLYTRVVPGDAIEMTSAFLDHEVGALVARRHLTRATLRQKQQLAAVIHLCGTGGGDTFIRRGLSAAGLRCGDHSVAAYLAQVTSRMRMFAALAR